METKDYREQGAYQSFTAHTEESVALSKAELAEQQKEATIEARKRGRLVLQRVFN